jgi:formamidopyrimidine-DNA glycosylase
MPELPEVESLRRSLLPYIIRQKILNIKILKPKLVSDKGTKRQISQSKTVEFINELTNETIIEIKRIAKNLIFVFESKKIMIVHLKMTGQLVYKSNIDLSINSGSQVVSGGHPIEESQTNLPHKHSHVIFTLENGVLYYNDVRMFGYLLFYPNWETLENSEHFSNLGMDPFEPSFTLENFITKIKSKKAKIKSVFLSQEVVVGLGNIYADEVCFAAKVRPDRNTDTLTESELESIYLQIQRIIPLAVSLGGSSIANYLLADGSRGNYAREHKVYNRSGEKCLVCGNILEKMIINSRTTVYCQNCQN